MIVRLCKCRMLKSFAKFLLLLSICLYVTIRIGRNKCETSTSKLRQTEKPENFISTRKTTSEMHQYLKETVSLDLLPITNTLQRTETYSTADVSLPTTETAASKEEWLSCSDLNDILTRQEDKTIFRNENSEGNRAIYFVTVYTAEQKRIRAVIKVANLQDPNPSSGMYRYRTALKEVNNLRRLRGLNWSGIPLLLGVCATNTSLTYAVTRVMNARAICPGRGLNVSCFFGEPFRNVLQNKPDPALAALTWVTKVTCFFAQFEKDRVFLEDFSGSNLYFDYDTLDIYLVDADSLIFYGDSRLYSRTLCRSDNDCLGPRGNLWGPNSLNQKVYSACLELSGYCVNNTCRGIDASLHTCGVGKWLIANVRNLIPAQQYNSYRELMHCMMETYPDKRCSMTSQCKRSKTILTSYSES
uniref:Uncharacterized protein n=1 Tax=Ciona savignyi TaxID=51511 RepID=H2ZQX3_CIOSA